MCRERPGPRCSDHSRAEVARLGTKLAVIKGKIEAAETELEQATKDGRATARIKKRLEVLKVREAEQKVEKGKADVLYDSTPKGQEELNKKLAQPNLPDQERLEIDEEKLMAQALRKWQLDCVKALRQAKAKGGIVNAITLAQLQLNNREQEVSRIHQELIKAAGAQESYEKNMRGLPPSSNEYLRYAKKVQKAKRFVRGLKRYQFALAIMTGDLEGYIKRNSKRLTNKATTNLFKGAIRSL